ncbi:MAG: hypothetical protein ACLVKR_07225 [Lachnospiraceae bacterium]
MPTSDIAQFQAIPVTNSETAVSAKAAEEEPHIPGLPYSEMSLKDSYP